MKSKEFMAIAKRNKETVRKMLMHGQCVASAELMRCWGLHPQRQRLAERTKPKPARPVQKGKLFNVFKHFGKDARLGDDKHLPVIKTPGGM